MDWQDRVTKAGQWIVWGLGFLMAFGSAVALAGSMSEGALSNHPLIKQAYEEIGPLCPGVVIRAIPAPVPTAAYSVSTDETSGVSTRVITLTTELLKMDPRITRAVLAHEASHCQQDLQGALIGLSDESVTIQDVQVLELDADVRAGRFLCSKGEDIELTSVKALETTYAKAREVGLKDQGTHPPLLVRLAAARMGCRMAQHDK